MINLLYLIFLFIIAYLTIFFAADVFLDNLKDICLIYGLSPFIVGAIILGIDPEESIASIIASTSNLPYLAVGNVIGNSIIALTVSFAIPAFFYKIEFKSISQFYFILLYLCMGFLLIGFFLQYGILVSGILALILYFIYLNRNLRQVSKENIIQNDSINAINRNSENNPELGNKSIGKKIVLVIMGFIFIFLGGELLIFSAERLIKLTNIPETFFGLVIIAFITNVEELTLVAKSIKNKSVEIGLGGMIGKIFWNLAITFGVSGIIILNFNFSLIIFWNWMLLFILLFYFNLISKKKFLYWKQAIVLTIFLFSFLFLNFTENFFN